MKKRKFLKTTSTLLLAGFLAIGIFHATYAQKNPQTFKIGEKFLVSELEMGEEAYVLDYKESDVTGDNIKDKIILVGNKLESPKDIFSDNLNIIVQDGKTQKYSKATYENFSGYTNDNPLFIGDFTGDQVSDVMVSAATGGSGGFVYHMIATFKDNNPKVIFNENDNDGIKVEGKYIDGFKAAFTIKNMDKKFILDLSSNKDRYIELGIYNNSGKLLEEIQPYMGPFIRLEPTPMNYDYNGIRMLRGSQRIAGICNADTISFVDSIWKFENNKWIIEELQYSTYIVK